MNVPDEIRKCVAFLQYQSGTGLRLAGTVFFVSMDEGELQFDYAVTARHVIETIRAKGVDATAYLRMNKPGGGVEDFPLPLHQWHCHPTDPVTDLAVAQLPRPTSFDLMVIPLATFAPAEEVLTPLGIGVGDEVFMVGLFYRHFGAQRNIPIVRWGNIAAMPEEPVDIGSGQMMDAYLIEMRSIGGLSGSPVFTWLLPFGKQLAARNNKPIYLLGVMHGHWNLEAELLDELTPDESGVQPLNTGIGVVVPVKKILEALHQERLQERRQEQIQQVQAMTPPTPDAGVS